MIREISPERPDVRDLAEGIMEHMEFPATVDAEKTRHGIRVAVNAGERDQFLIGPDGETLAALQHLLGRMIRAKMPEEAPPRLEVDVAGYRDRRSSAARVRRADREAKSSDDDVTTARFRRERRIGT